MQVKFRVRIIQTKRWSSSEHYINRWGGLYELSSMGLLRYLGAGYEVSLRTGLLDKNGQEINGGDIVRAPIEPNVHENVNWLVRWSIPEAGFELVTKNAFPTTLARPTQTLEVIGNRWETPELLGGTEGEDK